MMLSTTRFWYFAYGYYFILCFHIQGASALFADDAGVLDFVLRTAGHERPIHSVNAGGGSVTTTAGGCHVTGRQEGRVVWRRRVCEAPNNYNNNDEDVQVEWFPTTATSTSTPVVYWTSRSRSLLQAWKEGDLLWQDPEALAAWPVGDDVEQRQWVVVYPNEWRLVGSSNNMLVMDSIPSKSATGDMLLYLDKGQSVRVQVTPEGIVNRVTLMEYTVDLQKETLQLSSSSSNAFGHVKGPLLASSLRLVRGKTMMGVTTAGKAVVWSVQGDQFVAEATNILAVHPVGDEHVAVQTSDNSMQLYTVALDRTIGQPVHAVGVCPKANLLASWTVEGLQVSNLDGTVLTTVTDLVATPTDPVTTMSVLECTSEKLSLWVSTAGGTTAQWSAQATEATLDWTAQEGLSTVSSAIILDATHLGMDDLVDAQEQVLQRLSLSGRLVSQWTGCIAMLQSIVSGDFLSASSAHREHVFGFVKVAAVLSQNYHKLWGIATSGPQRGDMTWSLDLPKTADWHVMVHGTTNSAKAIHGINGGTQSREILVLSVSSTEVDWKCIDGTNGMVHSQATILDLESPVIQVLPMYGSAGACRQTALLMLDDGSALVVPKDTESAALVETQSSHTPHGLFTHTVDKAQASLQSFRVVSSSNGFRTLPVGRTSFQGEEIVQVAYPIRDEVVQTMSNILGDDSLLLKYINPHLAVIVTVTKGDEATLEKTLLASSVEKEQGGAAKPTRKPVGANKDAADSASTTTTTSGTDESLPNMFVNLVDTVSGRVLHRASHAHVDATRTISVLMSENWVVYSFVNLKSRRTELGVLTLHEGMIGSKGVTLFKSPEQTTSFSSLDARESKPVVLSKTYTYPKAISALGTTETRGGISSRKILIASNDGKITILDRHMLETRRPVGEVKEAEKKEGLFPYKELIPQVSMMSLNYNQTLESVTSIVSSPTSLESQSLVFAFGGPDLFFARTSPSRGFDLLPDSFSRVIVSIATVEAVIGLAVVQRMGAKKTLKLGWQ